VASSSVSWHPGPELLRDTNTRGSRPASDAPSVHGSDTVSLHGHLPPLDGVRGLALLMVLLLHFLGHMVPTNALERGVVRVLDFGRLGVALFFVLSGFLITGILLDAKGREHYFRNFYIRRALRIFPLYYGVLVLVLVIAPMVRAFHGPDLDSMRSHQMWAWLYGINFLIAVRGEFVMLYLNHFWSLAVEEHFYFCWPLVVWACSRERLMKVSLAIAFTSMLLSAGAAARGVSIMTLYVLTPFRLDGLCLGGFLAAWGRGPGGVPSLGRLARPLALGALATMLVTFGISRIVPSLQLAFHEVRVTMFDVLFGALIVRSLTAPPGTFVAWFFRSRWMRWLGVYSYGLYVFHHFIAFYFVRHQTEFVVTRWVGSHTLAVVLQAAVGTAASLVIALASYTLFESRFLALKRLWPSATEHRGSAPVVAPLALGGDTLALARVHARPTVTRVGPESPRVLDAAVAGAREADTTRA
jgi:peptidoglycan/LPS O-acetylase OafA/YrhL